MTRVPRVVPLQTQGQLPEAQPCREMLAPTVQPLPQLPWTTSILSPSGVLSAPLLLPDPLPSPCPTARRCLGFLLEIREGKQGVEKPGAGNGKAQHREKYAIPRKFSCRISFPW